MTVKGLTGASESGGGSRERLKPVGYIFVDLRGEALLAVGQDAFDDGRRATGRLPRRERRMRIGPLASAATLALLTGILVAMRVCGPPPKAIESLRPA